MPCVAAPGMTGVNSGYVLSLLDTMSMISVIYASSRSATINTARMRLSVIRLWREPVYHIPYDFPGPSFLEIYTISYFSRNLKIHQVTHN
jgi:hypothetical protein